MQNAPSRAEAMENYFNYFTEIEECYRRCRGTPSLLSPLDWALIEFWKDADLPLEAVLAGIERSFEQFKKRPRRFQKVNSLAYCSQEVLRAAEEARAAAVEGGNSAGSPAERNTPPFEPEEVRAFIEKNASALDKASRAAGVAREKVLADDLAAAAKDLRASSAREAGSEFSDLEQLEQRLSAIEEKLAASLTRSCPVERLAGLRAEVEKGLAPYRRKMRPEQVESLGRQFMKRRLFEHYGVPRLSLFYL